MRKDVNDLKKIVLDGFADPSRAAELIKDRADLFHGLNENIPTNEHVVLNLKNAEPVSVSDPHDDVQDISHEAEDDSLSIEKKEKELIMRALRKNNNKRKYAARDLGISERTLYRKIKQYELEE